MLRIVTISADGYKSICRYIDCLHAPRRFNSILVWCGSWFPLIRGTLELLPWMRSQWKKGLVFDELASHLINQRIQRQVAGEEVDDLVGSLLLDKQGLPRNFDIGEIIAEMVVFSKSLPQILDKPHSVQISLDQTDIPVSGRRLRYDRHRLDARHVLSLPKSPSLFTPPARNRSGC